MKKTDSKTTQKPIRVAFFHRKPRAKQKHSTQKINNFNDTPNPIKIGGLITPLKDTPKLWYLAQSYYYRSCYIKQTM
jgi:hypothetical protein